VLNGVVGISGNAIFVIGGKVKFTAGLNAANADARTFFMKVKMNP